MKHDYIKQGDCFDLMKELPDGSIDLVLIDPPYLISKKSNFNTGGSWNDINNPKHRKTPPKTDFGEWDKTEFDLNETLKECYRVLKQSGTLIVFYDVWKIQDLKDKATANKFKQIRLLRWDKTNPVPVNSKTNYLSNVSEYFISCVKGSKPTFNSEYDKGIYTYPICSGNERTEHPTQKPLVLIEALINKHSNKNDVVLDCFIGSGTTAVAAINTGRHYIGYELEPKYFEIAKKRIESEGGL